MLLKESCAQNSNRLLRTPEDENDRSKRIATITEGADNAVRVARRMPEIEAWSVVLSASRQECSGSEVSVTRYDSWQILILKARSTLIRRVSVGECCSVPADSTAGSRILSCNSFFKNTQKIQQKAVVLTRLGKGHNFFTWTCKEKKKKKKKKKAAWREEWCLISVDSRQAFHWRERSPNQCRFDWSTLTYRQTDVRGFYSWNRLMRG